MVIHGSHLDSVVNDVESSDTCVIVRGRTGPLLEAFEMKTKHVIVTVSLAMLKASQIRFNPPLPDCKMKAIEMINVRKDSHNRGYCLSRTEVLGLFGGKSLNQIHEACLVY